MVLIPTSYGSFPHGGKKAVYNQNTCERELEWLFCGFGLELCEKITALWIMHSVFEHYSTMMNFTDLRYRGQRINREPFPTEKKTPTLRSTIPLMWASFASENIQWLCGGGGGWPSWNKGLFRHMENAEAHSCCADIPDVGVGADTFNTRHTNLIQRK